MDEYLGPLDMAEELKDIFREHGIPMFLDSPTNQQFPVLENGMMEELRKRLRFSFWEKADETHTVTRFATSWSTAKQDLEILRRELEKIRKA